MTIESQFATENIPGEQAFDRAVCSVAEFIEERFKSVGDSYGPRMAGVLRMGVRASLAADGTTSVEDVRDVLTEQQFIDQLCTGDEQMVETVCRHLDALIPSDHPSERDTDGGIHE